MHPATRVARTPGSADPVTGGLGLPVTTATSYVRDAHGTYPGGHAYARDENPTGDAAEALLADLEGGAEALLFSSGMAAATALIDTFEPGTRVVAPRHLYWTVRRWLDEQAAAGRLHVSYVDNGDIDGWAAALHVGAPTVAWVESPSNPMAEITDLAAVSELARSVGARVVADGTTATPVHTRPIDHGVDIVLHSATKQLNGHGDVLAGALVTARVDEPWARVHHQRAQRGAVLGPFEAWLLQRGMRTLWVRVLRSSATAAAVAAALVDHPAVREVRYPGLADHPRHDVAARQMDGGFGMLVAFRVRGGAPAARRVLQRLELFVDASSLGSTESLVEHRARIEGPGTPVPDDLLRLSIGLEEPDDLIADLHHALDGADTGD